ncbi:hypothetical protein N9L68_08515 [bacterium]|nr:hypothetical protein [bacterium]
MTASVPLKGAWGKHVFLNCFIDDGLCTLICGGSGHHYMAVGFVFAAIEVLGRSDPLHLDDDPAQLLEYTLSCIHGVKAVVDPDIFGNSIQAMNELEEKGMKPINRAHHSLLDAVKAITFYEDRREMLVEAEATVLEVAPSLSQCSENMSGWKTHLGKEAIDADVQATCNYLGKLLMKVPKDLIGENLVSMQKFVDGHVEKALESEVTPNILTILANLVQSASSASLDNMEFAT